MTRQTQQEHNKEKMEYHLHLTKGKLVETSYELSNTKIKLDEVRSEANCKLALINSKLDEAHEELSHVKLQFSQKIDTLEALLHEKGNSGESSKPKSAATVAKRDWFTQLQCDSQSSLANQVIPVTFKMTGVEKKLKTKRDWYSDPFYTNNKGYRMRLCIDVYGCDENEGSHCSIFLYLMRGRFDDTVSWPLKIKLGIMLLNQTSDDHHLSHTVHFVNSRHDKDVTHRVIDDDMADSGLGSYDFISHGDLMKVSPICQFVKDDCIYVRVYKP